MEKLREDLLNSVGGEDGLTVEIIDKLSDAELVDMYEFVYGVEISEHYYNFSILNL